jgi:hypothetical protein
VPAMEKTADELGSIRNEQFLKERQEWLEIYQSACRRLGGKRWRERDRAVLFDKVEDQLWQTMRAKGMHHATFWRKCQMARKTLMRP